MFRPSKTSALLTACALGVCAASAAYADRLKIYIYSGTGFFINRDGYMLTNQHVVQECQRIMVSGAVSSIQASLVASDTEHDLALLKANVVPSEVAAFSDMRQALKPGDRVVMVGYPGDAYATGATVTREAQVVQTTGPGGEDKWLQLSDVVAQGNSGSPLMDTTGNVVGVIAAKAETYRYRKDDPDNGTTTREGIAISLPTVEAFLSGHGISYRTSNAEGYYSADRLTDMAKRFIVNVRCEYKTERVN